MSDCDSDMSQESRVKSQEEFDKFPIPNSLGNSEFLGNSNFFEDWGSGAVTLVFGKAQ